MVQEDTWFESDDGTKLFLRRWMPSTETPLAAAHIIHGMAEHGLRYARLAEKLTAAGIEVWAADQRGHGKTADSQVNAPGKGGLLGHCADGDGFERVTADVHRINQAIREKYPELPLFLMGHSWGSFIVQNYIERYAAALADGAAKGLAGCILSGSRGPGGFKTRAGLTVMSFLAALCGERNGSRLARALADGPYNQPFRPNRTAFDWLSRDEKEVDAYTADPCCGFLCSSGFYRDLVRGLCNIHQRPAMAQINPELPVYIFSGSADPAGDMGESPTALINAYRFLGIKDMEFVLYPNARHETLNETNREEVADNLLSWIKRHCYAI
jgi:alpha-beta hydrolase superfamily lysophospholipase